MISLPARFPSGPDVPLDPVYRVDPREHIGLLCSLVRRHVPVTVPLEDSEPFAEGMLGLLLACQQYDEGRGIAFATFATKVIKSTMYNAWRKRRKQSGVYDGLGSDQDFLEWLPAGEKVSSEIEKLEAQNAVRSAVQQLPERLRTVVEARMRGEKFHEIADRVGVSKQRVQQLEHQAHHLMLGQLAKLV